MSLLLIRFWHNHSSGKTTHSFCHKLMHNNKFYFLITPTIYGMCLKVFAWGRLAEGLIMCCREDHNNGRDPPLQAFCQTDTVTN